MQEKEAPATTEGYVECEFPATVLEALASVGSEPLSAIAWCRENRRAFAMLTRDPSGPDGALERHASVSASARGVGRCDPDADEVHQAIAALGLTYGEFECSMGGMVFHAWENCRPAPAVSEGVR